jgi:hypothetical protein
MPAKPKSTKETRANNQASRSCIESTCSSFVRMFKPQFAGLVERGKKLQTIRPTPKRMPKSGDKISLRAWIGKPYRSKQRVLREAIIEEVVSIRIDERSLETNGVKWCYHGISLGMESFAERDGFQNWSEMVEWFRSTHGLPFEGVLIRWTNAELTHPESKP